MQATDFEMVIGLEVHVQLNTKSKMFCADANQYGGDPNQHTSVVSLAHPGTLPVINSLAIRSGIALALAINSRINRENRFDRKHYFYPDLPKGYQLTQDVLPICIGGQLNIGSLNNPRIIRFHHVHMEEDAGKSIHHNPAYSMIDLNRAGVPLLELVTEPDMRSGKEVHDFIEKLQLLVQYLNISDGNMDEGSLRCDCNVSVRPIGEEKYGERCEIKNLNSKKFAWKAVEYEAKRQINEILKGNIIERTTLHFDPNKGITYPTREKEDANDYRYFPDPDLPPIYISEEMIRNIADHLPVLPDELYKTLIGEHHLSAYQADIICRDYNIAQYFLRLSNNYSEKSAIANLLINKVMPFLKESNTDLDSFPVSDMHCIEFLEMINKQQVVSSVAFQQLFPAMISNPSMTPQSLAKELNLIQTAEEGAEEMIVKELIHDFPEEVKKFKAGKKALLGFFIGQAMRMSKTPLNPGKLKKLLVEALEK